MRRGVLAFLRREVLAAVGVVGLAVNLLGGLAPFLRLARMARYLVEHWVQATAFVWVWLFHLIHIRLPALLGFALTLLVFHAGLTISALRFRHAETLDESRTATRDRVLALLLYLPIMVATILTAFGHLARHISSDAEPDSQGLTLLAFAIVVAAPVATFALSRPRRLVRRFLSVYSVAVLILLLDWAAGFLDATGLSKKMTWLGEMARRG